MEIRTTIACSHRREDFKESNSAFAIDICEEGKVGVAEVTVLLIIVYPFQLSSNVFNDYLLLRLQAEECLQFTRYRRRSRMRRKNIRGR